MSTTHQSQSDLAVVRWQRGVPVFGVPVRTRNFYFLLALTLLGFILAIYRQVAGLGAATGLSDGFPWGIWKTFNVMTLTALGSGSFPIGIAAWLFHKRRLHAVMRTTLLISFLVYLTGLLAIAVDVGRPWNVYNFFDIFRWNTMSPMWEVLWCMPLYCMFPLLLENTPPVLEQGYYFFPPIRGLVVWLVPIIRMTYPYVVALAYVLPMMHQSALGGLMLMAGTQVQALWQTPLLPLLYMWAAAWIGVATTIGAMMLSCTAWKLPMDQSILDELVDLMLKLIKWWVIVRLADIVIRAIFLGQFFKMLTPWYLPLLFLAEMLLIAVPAWKLQRPEVRNDHYQLWLNCFYIVAGGLGYRFDPTTFAYRHWSRTYYTPAIIEILVSLGFISFCIIAYTTAVKRLPILPAPVEQWYESENYYKKIYPYIQLSEHGNQNQHRPNYAD
ncbi:MAG TPA: Ni/Fe-hydrogenase cytochrome b subunit [Candidatus Angelobacter sp.]|jgi:Ni/Fe-hydrogenase subunit HybB-like protein|nr:Ni/Fe-hydrogenase cytochrome b subunit [Candidatus Angelobacter sp.]